MMWYRGDGWGWCSMTVNVLTTVVLWGVVFTAIVLAVRFLSRERSGPWAPRGTGSTRAEYMMAEGFTRGEMDNDEFYRVLM